MTGLPSVTDGLKQSFCADIQETLIPVQIHGLTYAEGDLLRGKIFFFFFESQL